MLKAVIFDLDGTIGDTLPICVEAFRKSIQALSGVVLTDDEIVATFGPTEEYTVRRFLPDRFDEGMDAYLRNYTELHATCPSPFDGMLDLIRFLRDKGLVVSLVTGKGPRSAAITLRQYGLSDAFDDIRTGSPTGSTKAENIAEILARHNLRPDEAVYVGDAPTDIIDSRKAGVPIFSAAWATMTHPEKLAPLNPDKLFHSIPDLRSTLEQMLGERG